MYYFILLIELTELADNVLGLADNPYGISSSKVLHYKYITDLRRGSKEVLGIVGLL